MVHVVYGFPAGSHYMGGSCMGQRGIMGEARVIVEMMVTTASWSEHLRHEGSTRRLHSSSFLGFIFGILF